MPVLNLVIRTIETGVDGSNIFLTFDKVYGFNFGFYNIYVNNGIGDGLIESFELKEAGNSNILRFTYNTYISNCHIRN